MQINDNCLVHFHYSLLDEKGQIIESTRDGDPIPYLHGKQNIVPGLETAMTGRSAGDSFQVKLKPEQGYGLYDEDKVYDVAAELFKDFEGLEPGALCQLTNEQGQPELVTIIEIGEEQITVDGNHPYAGINLKFSVEVISVRAANEQELAAGHPLTD